MNVEENCIPTNLWKDGKWSKEKSVIVKLELWFNLFQAVQRFKKSARAMEAQAYCFTSHSWAISRHRHSWCKETLIDVFIYARPAKLWKPTQITNNHSQLLLSSQSSIAFRVKHAAPISDKRSLTETSVCISENLVWATSRFMNMNIQLLLL